MSKRQTIIGLACLLVFVAATVCAGAEGKLLGDESDGSRAHPIHRIELLALIVEQCLLESGMDLAARCLRVP